MLVAFLLGTWLSVALILFLILRGSLTVRLVSALVWPVTFIVREFKRNSP